MRRVPLFLLLLITPLATLNAQNSKPQAAPHQQQQNIPSQQSLPGSPPPAVPPPGPPQQGGNQQPPQQGNVAQQAAAVEEDPDWAVTLERIATSVVSIEVDSTRAFDTEWNSTAQA